MTDTKRLFLAALERRRNRGADNTGPFAPTVNECDSYSKRQTALARQRQPTRKADR